MKKTLSAACFFLLAQVAMGQGNSKLTSYSQEVNYTTENQVNFVKLNENQTITEAGAAEFINSVILNDGINKVAVLKRERDGADWVHVKFSARQNGVVISNKIIIAHFMNGKLVSLNGDLSDPQRAGNSFVISEKTALKSALAKVNAKKYKWENKEEEQHMRNALNDPDFSYAPSGEKVIFEKSGKLYNAFRFNIYAETPLYRANVFVDASNGKILEEHNLICHADVPATAVTKYSGTQGLTVDYTGSLHRLREVQRGLGIETFNMKNTSVYSTNAAADFTNATTSWTTTGFDQAATDAHWGAEKTYDYFFNQHGRNSINNAGFKLLSFVHYQTNYQNAFWDGQRMTYGDGNGTSTKIFTALDVCGHEITHGLTSNTGNLIYSNESGAINESYSDIFGTSIENFARPTNWNWKIGEDLIAATNGALRRMDNPNAYGDPDTYGGQNYYTGTADNGGVHTNSGVNNYWYYLLVTGGSGTNDLSNAFSVTGLGFTNASKIAFRALTVYFTPSTNYAAARLLTIQAAKDLFGACSNEVIQTTRAWYAVGVGANYIPGVAGSNFTSNNTNFCSAPANASFINTTTSGLTYVWNFGDGATSTATNAVHTYTAAGTYAVKLKATGCASAVDSITKTAFIVVSPPVASPLVSGISACENSSVVLNGSSSGTLKWYNSPSGGTELGTGSSFSTPGLSATTTYYAANTLTLAPVYGGLLSNTNGGYSSTNTNYIIFNVLQNSVLNSVTVYAQTVANCVVQLRSASNVVIYSTTVSLNIGVNVVALNYNLTPGNNFRLGLSSTSNSSLYRTNNSVAYPYNIGGAVSLVSSSTGTGSYYFFYNWKIAREECASARVPVVALINPLPVVTIGAPTTAVCIGDKIDIQGTPSGGSYFGSAMSGSLFSVNALAGTYTISYFYTDNNFCSNSADASVIVSECTGISSSGTVNSLVSIYPNPAKEYLVIRSELTNAKISIMDALGRSILTKDLTLSEEKIKLETLTTGLYMISIQDGSGKTIKTMKLIKE